MTAILALDRASKSYGAVHALRGASLAVEPGEVITGVAVPFARGPQEYLKVGARNAVVTTVASLALVVDAGARTARVGLGAVGPVARRAPAAEEHLRENLRWDGNRPSATPELVERFAGLVATAADPTDDHRASARYRRHAISVLAGRALRRVAGG